MFRRFAVVAFAAVALAQTGCHGRVSAFFYRLTHCDSCSPYYGYSAPIAAPAYAAPGCSTCSGSPVSYGAPVMPIAATVPPPVFTNPTPMTGPQVYPTPGSTPEVKK